MSTPAKLPGSLAVNRRLDQWLRFNPDRSVTVYTGKVEIGQGVITAMAQIAAEELDVALTRVRVVSGDTVLTPDEGHTSGSRSIDEGGSAMRYACAEARHLLLREASKRLDIPPDKLTIEDGVISGFDRIHRVSYWDLPHAQVLDREATAAFEPKPAARHTIVGTMPLASIFRTKSPARRASCTILNSPACCSAASCVRRRTAHNSRPLTPTPCASCPVWSRWCAMEISSALLQSARSRQSTRGRPRSAPHSGGKPNCRRTTRAFTTIS